MIANEKGGKFGAIANGWIGMNYGLKIICREIQDNSFNQTRFWIIGRKRYQFTGRDKTSIAFSFHDDRPGNLFAVLKEFAQAEVNLTMIQSRPAKAELGKYIFFIDFIGHEEEERIKKVLDDVKKITRVCKVMGSYPRAL
jgi:prephenate dehydratase